MSPKAVSNTEVHPQTSIKMEPGQKKNFDPSEDLGFAPPATGEGEEESLYDSLVDGEDEPAAEGPEKPADDDDVNLGEDEPVIELEDDDESEGDDDAATDVERLTAQNQDLQDRIAKLEGAASVPGAPTSSAAEETVYTPVQITLSEDDFEALQDSHDGAQKVLNRVVNESLKQALPHAAEQTLRKSARTLPAQMSRMAEAYVAAAFFRRENKDLARDTDVLTSVHQRGLKLSAAHPSWSVERVLRESGKLVRADLAKIAERVQRGSQPAEEAGSPPGRVGSTPTRKVKRPLTGLQAELAKLKPGL